MLDCVEVIFEEMQEKMKKLKKASYEKNMKDFREKNGHFFQEMTQYMQQSEDKEAAAKEIAVVFTQAVKKEFSVKGKLKSRMQVDLNFFMIYYVFPAILLEESEDAELIAKNIRDKWHTEFPGSNIQYADYDKIHDAFREKILGIF